MSKSLSYSLYKAALLRLKKVVVNASGDDRSTFYEKCVERCARPPLNTVCLCRGAAWLIWCSKLSVDGGLTKVSAVSREKEIVISRSAQV